MPLCLAWMLFNVCFLPDSLILNIPSSTYWKSNFFYILSCEKLLVFFAVNRILLSEKNNYFSPPHFHLFFCFFLCVFIFFLVLLNKWVVTNEKWDKMGRKTLTFYRNQMSFSKFEARRITLCYILFRRKYRKHAGFWNTFFLVL